MRLTPLHLAGKLNITAEWLSRANAPNHAATSDVQQLLASVKVRIPPERWPAYYRLPTPATTGWWGGRSDVSPNSAWLAISASISPS